MNTSSLSQQQSSVAGAEADSPLADMMIKPMRRYDLALEPQDYDASWKIAEACAKMRLCGCLTAEDAYLRILAGRAIGLPAMASVQSIIPIYNKKEDTYTLTMYVKTKLALVLSRPDIIEYVRPTLISNEKAIFVGKRKGKDHVEQSYEFSMEDAIKAGLVGRGADGGLQNNYDRHPRSMLAWRACGRLLDLIAGDILNGIASHEDIAEEIEREANATPRGTVPETVKASVPVRDWAAEAAAIKDELTRAATSKDAAAAKETRRRFAAFQTEAPAQYSEEVQKFYNVLKGEVKRAEAPAAPAASHTAAEARAAQAARLAGQPQQPTNGTLPLPTAQAPAASKNAYLPPKERGDSYEGPDSPPPPFG